MIYIHFGHETPSDPEYKRFLENYSCDEEKSMANPETLLGEIEAKTRELIGTVPNAQMIISLQIIISFRIQVYINSTYSKNIKNVCLLLSVSSCFSQTDNTTVGVHQK